MKLLLCRTIILYLCVLFAMRLMGKRQLGELQPEELVSTILISNLASISIESEDVPITASLIPLFLTAALELLGSVVSFRSLQFSLRASQNGHSGRKDRPERFADAAADYRRPDGVAARQGHL